MLKAKTRWKITESNKEQAVQLAEGLNVSPLVATLLIERGIETLEAGERFLHKVEVDFYDPFLLAGMELAVERIQTAIKNKEKILIFGDYDADGVSSTSVMVYTMSELGAEFDYYIPNRFTEGYGPNETAFRRAKEEGYSVIITVDTGIAAIHEAEVAKELGIDLIITDHHEIQPILPNAYAIINPKQKQCPYPYKELAGVGVAFKVAHALLGRVPEELLDLVAIGTIADLVPLVDENRLIAKRGIQALQTTKKPGIIALKKICGITNGPLNADHIGFAMGPRINAAGRLESAQPAVQLLTTPDEEEAKELASYIDELNKERQALVNEITEQAIKQVEERYPLEENHVLIVAEEDWNVGVIGIVASRLVERYYRPTIVLNIDREKGEAKGSARSIAGFDMFAELSKNKDLLPHFGGHPMAAGLTMNVDDLDLLRKNMNEQAKASLSEEDFIPITNVDLVASLDEISLEVIEQLNQLAPFGVANPTPKVMIDDVSLSQYRRIGSEEKHLKLTFEQAGATLDGIGFQLGYLFDEITPIAKVSAIGTLSINEWNGYVKPQFIVEDVAINKWQLFDWRGVRHLKDKLKQLPIQKRCFVCFDKTTSLIRDLEEWKEGIVHIEELTATHMIGKYVVLLDLPQSLEQMEKLFQHKVFPERIYTVFHHEDSHFFQTMPTREHFKWYYAFLKQRGAFHIQEYATKLAKQKGWSERTINFMTKVFFELDFVTINGGLIHLNHQPAKKDLTESMTYTQRLEQAKIENQYLYSSYIELKELFNLLQQKTPTSISGG